MNESSQPATGYGPAPVLNVAAHLPAMAARRPDALAIAVPDGRERGGATRYRRTSFAELDLESGLLAAGLREIGIDRGVRAAVMVPPSLELFALFFALFKIGAVPVMVDPGMGTRALKECLDEASPTGFLGVAKAHTARLALRWARESVRVPVSVGTRLGFGGHTLAKVRRLGERAGPAETVDVAADETAAVLFTSGSTGLPKGAVYTHGNFAAQVDLLRDLYGIEPGEVDLPTFPLFALFDPALGMSTVLPEMDFTRPAKADPVRIVEAIRTFGCTNMFGSPALLDSLGRHLEATGTRLPSLHRVISAGAPVPAAVLRRVTPALTDGAEVFTPYGATECLPVASVGSREILAGTAERTDAGAGVCIGRAVPPNDVRVIRIDDGPLPTWSDDLDVAPGKVGEIVVRGPTATASYFARPEATALAKIQVPGGGFFHRMGDLGYRDGDDRLWFCGRKSHRVQTAAGTLHTVPVEAVFNTHPRVRRTALVGVGEPGSARPVLCVEMEAGESAKGIDRELADVGAGHAHTAGVTTFLVHPGFPVDPRHNAKIFREKLAEWASGRLR